MFQQPLTVKYITSKNCFLFLSSNNFKHLGINSVSLEYKDHEKVYMSVVSSTLVDDQSIGISSSYAKALNINENVLVHVSAIPRPPTVNRVTVTTCSENDHYVLESLADVVQSTLLQQIHVLFNDQFFTIWIGKSLYVTIQVCKVEPVSPGTIDHLTEVIIKSPNESKKDNKNVKNKALDNTKVKIQTNMLDSVFNEYKDKNNNLVLRIVPFKELAKKIDQLCQPFNVFIFKDSFSNKFETSTENPLIYSMKLLTDSGSETEDKIIYVRLYLFEDFLDNFTLKTISKENVFVSDVVMDFFNCDMGSRVLLELHKNLPLVNEIEICAKRSLSFNIKEIFQQYLADNCRSQSFILNPNLVLNLNDKFQCLLRFLPYEAKFCLVNSDFVRDCKLSFVNENLPRKENSPKDEPSIDKFVTNIINYEEIIDLSEFLFVSKTEDYCEMNTVLITGKTGTGKSTLLKIIKHKVNSHPYYIFTRQIDCKSIKGKTIESLNKLFTQTFLDLVHHQPSVLILDDLHILCENINEHDALAQNAVYFNRVSELLESVFKNFCEHNAVGILATATSAEKLNKHIYATRGNHLFKNVYTIDQLSKKDRKRILKFLFANYDHHEVDFEKLIEKTESFVMQDMTDLFHKALFESYQDDDSQSTIKITQKCCEKALETVILTSLEGINLHSPGDKDLNDIGGLQDAKHILIETMLWPAKYPDLFTNAPLRLPSGLLLYGPPGTGKTILAGAAAKHCGLRLISIKGPELLSKYIGASEQAVRDVFVRAQSAKPCVLFFDEFDSLAPRRGHDNTGVTDRVVNQLLTQLDGVETLSGVFILAATSRPDLLDPALLRPGRLDRHIRCSLPDETSRLEILKALSHSLLFDLDVDLEELARKSQGFSGADLQAVLYSAQLESVKHLLEDEENIQEFETKICQAQLIEALKSTRPSLSKSEQSKYELLYQRFEGTGSKDLIPGSRATLA